MPIANPWGLARCGLPPHLCTSVRKHHRRARLADSLVRTANPTTRRQPNAQESSAERCIALRWFSVYCAGIFGLFARAIGLLDKNQATSEFRKLNALILVYSAQCSDR